MRPADQLPALLSPDASGGQHLPMAVLRQYVAGTLSAAEQHHVEAHTLTCSRCADVLEGLSQTDLATTDQAVSDLQARLRARLAQEQPDVAPVVPMWPWRQMAAAIVLLLVSTAIWLGVRRTTEGPAAAPQIAMRQPEKKLEEAAKPSSEPAASAPEVHTEAALTDKAIASAPAPVKQNEAVTLSKPTRSRLNARRQQEGTTTEVSAVTLANEAVAGTADVASVAEESKAAAPVAADTAQLAATKQAHGNKESSAAYARMAPTPKAKPANTQAASVSKPMVSNSLNGRIESAVAAPASMRVVRGRVTDRTSGALLPGVTVAAKGTNLATTTAADGSFSLLVPESVKALTFSYVGFAASEQGLAPKDTLVALALAPDTKSLNEVVVVRRERPPAPISIGALPAGGYKAFQEYLKKELEYPEEALKEGKEGNVKLSFTVAEDGSLQDIKVVRGISEECDAEAIRLLKEGPKWYPAVQKGRRTARTVEVSVPFRPEDHR
ncbi:TonB family protein [Hymenobacter sp. YC55]|uniref:TonB family protein n=1 Tax=Hymenobacter sp. YC55 TaxID=3034019 RepID=UPI0023F984AB|nr:TonB family protein [Hymenobacter sp. YC55]MDF7812521.1 TonB family protein [Hymenobacter sp. YC55]